MKRCIGSWNLIRVTLLLLWTWCFTACSDEGDSTTGRGEYKYLFAAEERDSTPVADRAEFAPYGWRNEYPASEAMPQNFRTCQGPFVERDAKTGYDATFVPSRRGLDCLNISASSDFSEIIEREHQQMYATLGTWTELVDISGSNDYVPLKDIVYRQTNIGGEFPVYTGSDPDVKPWTVQLWEEMAEMIPLFYQYVQECHTGGYTTTWGTWKQLLWNGKKGATL